VALHAVPDPDDDDEDDGPMSRLREIALIDPTTADGLERRTNYLAGQIDEEASDKTALRKEVSAMRSEFAEFRQDASQKANQILAVLATGAVLAALNVVLMLTRGGTGG
jgi:hypothetical protein